MRAVCVIQARVGSTRLPQKVLRPICGRPMLIRIWERLCLARQLDGILAAIPDTAKNDTLAAILEREGIGFVRGPEERLATRLLKATDGPNIDFPRADAIVRVTGDCPLIDPAVVDQAVATWRDKPETYYVSNVWPMSARSWPEGLDCEVMTRGLLTLLCGAAREPVANASGGLMLSDVVAEHSPSEWIWKHPDIVSHATIHQGPVPPPFAHLHWSVDTAEDLEGARRVYERLPEGFGWREVIEEFGPLSLPDIATLPRW